MKSQAEFVFEPFRLDAINERLWRDGKEIRLTPKAFSVLRYLAENSDQLITKEVLLKTLWPNISVTDAVLTVCIGEIRKAPRRHIKETQIHRNRASAGISVPASRLQPLSKQRCNYQTKHSLLQHR
jgi:DNA-binding winged helix-turn-helix (wHTH) protein